MLEIKDLNMRIEALIEALTEAKLDVRLAKGAFEKIRKLEKEGKL